MQIQTLVSSEDAEAWGLWHSCADMKASYQSLTKQHAKNSRNLKMKMCFTPEDMTEPNNHTVQGGNTNICVIRQQGNNFKCSRGNDTVNLREPLVAYWSLKQDPSEASPNCPQEQLVCTVKSSQRRDETGSFVFRVWIKMQLVFCTSLTLLSCTDLRCSFDLRVVVNVQVEQHDGVYGAVPFEAVVQNTFYLPPSIWEQVNCPKPQLELCWA